MPDLNEKLMENLAADIDRKMDRRFGAIERHIGAVGKEIETVSKQTAFLLRAAGVRVKGEDGVTDDEAVAQVDETWQCGKCGSRLGYYDPTEDILRVRHKDLTFWVKLGEGGHISIVCRSCGELNTVSWTPSEPETREG